MVSVDFIDSTGASISVRCDMIKHVARPKGGYPGEVELTTGAKWGFGSEDRQIEYRRVLAAFEKAQAYRQEQAK